MCAALMTAFTLLGPVEDSTDLAHNLVGYEHENALLTASTLFWSAVASLIQIALDRMLERGAQP